MFNIDRIFVWEIILELTTVGLTLFLLKAPLYSPLIFLVLMWQILGWLSWKVAPVFKLWLLITVIISQQMAYGISMVSFQVAYGNSKLSSIRLCAAMIYCISSIHLPTIYNSISLLSYFLVTLFMALVIYRHFTLLSGWVVEKKQMLFPDSLW